MWYQCPPIFSLSTRAIVNAWGWKALHKTQTNPLIKWGRKRKKKKKLTQISLLSNNDIMLYQYAPIFFLATRAIVSTYGWKGYMIQKSHFIRWRKKHKGPPKITTYFQRQWYYVVQVCLYNLKLTSFSHNAHWYPFNIVHLVFVSQCTLRMTLDLRATKQSIKWRKIQCHC
jgi:hypothetical protein